MLNLREVSLEIGRLTGLQALVRAYSEIAALRVQRTRHAVLENRAFMQGLSQVYEALKRTYRAEILKLMQKRRILDFKKLTLIRRNGRVANVLLSAQTGFYGDFIRKTYTLFKETVRRREGEIVIVGKLGAALFREDYPQKNFTYFDFPDHKVEVTDLGKISSYLLQFEKVLVFYGRFETIISQRSCFSSVSGEGFERERGGEETSKTRYLFEPPLEEILNFFESEIFASLFAQTLYENHLAKFAARMLNLDASAERIKKRLEMSRTVRLRFKHRRFNRKQQEGLLGMTLWG